MKKYFAVFITLYSTVLLYMMFYAPGREPSGLSYIQWKPFITIDHFFNDDNINKSDFAVNIIGNIFLFSPFGWLGLLLKKFNQLIPITLFFLISITIIESLQYNTGRGVADIDDIFLNTFGMLIGFSIYKLFTYHNLFNINIHFNINKPTKRLLIKEKS